MGVLSNFLCTMCNRPLAFTFYSHTPHITSGAKWEAECGVDCRVFSNLFPCVVEIDSQKYSSTETYFQQYKYPEGDKNFLNRLTSMSDVASFGQRRLKLARKHIKLIEALKEEGAPHPIKRDGTEYAVKDKSEPQLIITDWESEKIPVMYVSLRAKFNQHENLKQILLNTGDAWLVEHTKNDKQWADGLTGEGTNYLGKLLMQVREEIKNQEEPQPASLEFVKNTMTFDYTYLRTPM